MAAMDMSAAAFQQCEPRGGRAGPGPSSKDAFEKQRIALRQEAHTRYDPPETPLDQVPALNAARRPDHTSRAKAVDTLRAQTCAERERYQGKLSCHRSEHLLREHEHRCRTDAKFENEERSAARCRERAIRARNESGGSFNILSCRYDDTAAGRALQARDQATKARAADRTGRFYAAGHKVKHDIITGHELRLPCTVPERFRVRAPWEQR